MSTTERLAQLAHGSWTRADPRWAHVIEQERLAPLIYARTANEPADVALRDALRPVALRAAARDLAQTRVLHLAVAAAPDLDMLVIKGSATGPMLYEDGSRRPRADVDVWLDGWDAAQTLACRLTDEGFRPIHQLPGEFARHAIALRRQPGEELDVHAAPSRRVRVARALPFAEAWAARQVLEVGPIHTHALSDAHAWLLAAVHLAAHHAGQQAPAILLEDLRRLALRLTPADWRSLKRRITNAGLCSATRAGVATSRRWSKASVDAELWQFLARTPDDPSELFNHPATAILDDLDCLDGDDSLRYLRELLYPTSDYLESHFGIARSRPRALLATHRLLAAAVAPLWRRRHNQPD